MAPLYVFLFLVLAFRGRCARLSKFGTKACVAFCHSLRSILVISGHSHQRCWRVLSPFLSADRGLVLSQKAQGEKHDILMTEVAATIHLYVKFSLLSAILSISRHTHAMSITDTIHYWIVIGIDKFKIDAEAVSYKIEKILTFSWFIDEVHVFHTFYHHTVLASCYSYNLLHALLWFKTN